MDRRASLKTLVMGAVAPKVVLEGAALKEKNAGGQAGTATPATDQKQAPAVSSPYSSPWHLLPDMDWTGEELWAQRLQDWRIRNGALVCLCAGPNRTVHLLTHQLSAENASFRTSVNVYLPASEKGGKGNFAGFKVGIKGRFPDYRSAVITGKGLNAGVNTDGSLFIGQTVSHDVISMEMLSRGIRLSLSAVPVEGQYSLELTASAFGSGKALAGIKAAGIEAESLAGGIALVSHFDKEQLPREGPATAFSEWELSGEKVSYFPQRVFGPVYFAQYTVNNGILKLSAQLAPVELPGKKSATLEIKKNGQWEKAADAIIHPQARVAAFRIEGWDAAQSVPYRVKYEMTLRSGSTPAYYYEGAITAEPADKEKVKALVFSCNWDLGFPDSEVVENASRHQADMIFFLGDQFYEPNGGFGIQTFPLDKAILDYIRKWAQFGWSYRELFRHIPMVCLPDDHDMYHGNLWGARGKATIHEGSVKEEAVLMQEGERKRAVRKVSRADMSDSGGYIMPPDWVNMAQLCQTSHMPDPYDPTPVRQGISVFYTHWQYGGISFGIIEDRKFKSAPKEALPEKARVWNGYAENRQFDIRKYHEPETVRLLGDRQMKFLEEWGRDWSRHAQFKVLISATPFMCLQTLPAGTVNDQVTPRLEVPEEGVYVQGDAPTRDMDTDGWPQNRRDEVLRVLRKSFALHLAGDQHLPSTVHYGVDEYADSGFVFTVPATTNFWPRRWWPSLDKDHEHLPGKAAYTGNFKDGFGNKITVYAAANPYKTGKEPSLLYDRVTGYGVAVFDKPTRKVTLECWPRYVDPLKNPKGQYRGWPVEVQQTDNYGRKAMGYLPTLEISGITDPVIEVIHEGDNELEYTLRIRGQHFRPGVFREGAYTVRVSDPDTGKQQALHNLHITNEEKQVRVHIA